MRNYGRTRIISKQLQRTSDNQQYGERITKVLLQAWLDVVNLDFGSLPYFGLGLSVSRETRELTLVLQLYK